MPVRKTTVRKAGPGGKGKKKVKKKKSRTVAANPKATKKTNRYGF